MQLKHQKSIVFLILCFLSLITIQGCTKSSIDNAIEDLVDAENEEDNDDDEQPIPSLTASVDNIEFKATTLISQSLTGARITTHDFGYSIVITGQYLSPDLKSSKVILLFIYGTDFDQLVANTEFKTIGNLLFTEPPGAYALYTENPNSDIDSNQIGTGEVESIYVKITSIDKEKQLISGEFNFVGVIDDTNQKITVTNGVFTHLNYIKE